MKRRIHRGQPVKAHHYTRPEIARGLKCALITILQLALLCLRCMSPALSCRVCRVCMHSTMQYGPLLEISISCACDLTRSLLQCSKSPISGQHRGTLAKHAACGVSGGPREFLQVFEIERHLVIASSTADAEQPVSAPAQVTASRFLMWTLWAFCCSLVFFHITEFFLAYVYNRKECAFELPYCSAMGCAVAEHSIWTRPMKFSPHNTAIGKWVPYVGLALMTLGELLRKAAMVTAKQSFTHKIRSSRQQDHTLVTTGVYAVFRHPGYLGWYMWAVGTQVLLCNPICTAAFTYAATRFFGERIPIEEHKLLNMFGASYASYAARTPILIPGVHGYWSRSQCIQACGAVKKQGS